MESQVSWILCPLSRSRPVRLCLAGQLCGGCRAKEYLRLWRPSLKRNSCAQHRCFHNLWIEMWLKNTSLTMVPGWPARITWSKYSHSVNFVLANGTARKIATTCALIRLRARPPVNISGLSYSIHSIQLQGIAYFHLHPSACHCVS